MQFIKIDKVDENKKVIEIQVCASNLQHIRNASNISTSASFADDPKKAYERDYKIILDLFNEINVAHFFLIVKLEGDTYYIIELLKDGYHINKVSQDVLFLIGHTINC